MPHPIKIVDYDPQWPILYEEEKRRIIEIIGHKIAAIEHIGSTAVPGLGGKPIIDIMAGVNQPTEADECLVPLEKIGYQDVTPQPDNSEWYYCLGKVYHGETVKLENYHLHLVKFMSDHWKKHLFFRDFLRTHPNTAQKYYELKKKLATKYDSDRVGYTNAKITFIESVIAQAIYKTQLSGELLMSKVYVDCSSIHGKGVFAAVDIKEGEQILKLDDSRVVTNDNPLRPEKGEYQHHCDYVENGKVILMQEPERYINHCCEPNVYVKTIDGTRYVYAIRNIKAGEEITFDYCINGYGDSIWQCLCGSPKCRKIIDIDFFHLPKQKKLEYLPYLDEWFIRENKKKIKELRSLIT